MKSLLPSSFFTLLSLVISSTLGFSQTPNPARDLGMTIFASADENDDKSLSSEEIKIFGKSMFISMDYSENGIIEFEEFVEWDFGFNFIAEDSTQKQSYGVAQKILFALWDINNSDDVDIREVKLSLAREFSRADRDEDDEVSEEEYLSNFIISRALQAALEVK